MFRKMLALALIGLVMAGALAEGFREVETPVFREALTGETAPLRYYDDLPGVPCMGLNEFYRLMTGRALSVSVCDGVYAFAAPGGATAEVDVGAGTLRSADFTGFTNMMGGVAPGMDNQYLDAPAFVRPAGLECEGPAPVTLDFAKYEIPLHGEEGDVYLPVTTLSDVFTNLAYMYLSFNGETLYVNADNRTDPAWERDADYALPIYGRADRDPGLAAYAYRELCFVMDHFYGFPGRAELNDDLAALGLDGALQAHSDVSRRCRTLLMSEKLGEYALGSILLSALLDDGGHTGLDFTELYTKNAAFADFATDYYMAAEADAPDRSVLTGGHSRAARQNRLRQMRRDAWGSGHYAEKGDTAVIWFDSFMYDFDGWMAYYQGGPRPEGDMMAHVIDGLNRAAANPEIRNVVLDVSCNPGGSADMVVAIMSLIAGEEEFRTENLLTRCLETQHYRVDRNFDGVFDERDAAVRYDFRCGVLTSRLSFSCGNLLPSLMKDRGLAVLGETSGGGTCAVTVHATPEGLPYQISSALGRLINAAGETIDEGVPVDVPIEEDRFYDIDLLSRAMNDFYGERE